MTKYNVDVSATAEKQLANIPRADQIRILRAIKMLGITPRPPGCRKLTGFAQTFRIRVGRYRVIYDVNDRRIVVVILKVGHRKDVYR